MKKLLITALLALVSVGAFGQGQIIFNNNGSTLVTNMVTGLNAPSGTKAGLYMAVGLSQAAGALTMQGATAAVGVPLSGQFAGGTRTTALPAGPVTVQVRAWFAAAGNPYTTYEQAQAAQAGDSSVLLGTSALLSGNIAASPTPAVTLLSLGLTSFGLSGVVVPEPSSIALGLLGLGAIAMFRRKK